MRSSFWTNAGTNKRVPVVFVDVSLFADNAVVQAVTDLTMNYYVDVRAIDVYGVDTDTSKQELPLSMPRVRVYYQNLIRMLDQDRNVFAYFGARNPESTGKTYNKEQLLGYRYMFERLGNVKLPQTKYRKRR